MLRAWVQHPLARARAARQLSVLLSARTELPLRRCHANTTVEHTPSHYGDPTGHKVTVGKLSP